MYHSCGSIIWSGHVYVVTEQSFRSYSGFPELFRMGTFTNHRRLCICWGRAIQHTHTTIGTVVFFSKTVSYYILNTLQRNKKPWSTKHPSRKGHGVLCKALTKCDSFSSTVKGLSLDTLLLFLLLICSEWSTTLEIWTKILRLLEPWTGYIVAGWHQLATRGANKNRSRGILLAWDVFIELCHVVIAILMPTWKSSQKNVRKMWDTKYSNNGRIHDLNVKQKNWWRRQSSWTKEEWWLNTVIEVHQVPRPCRTSYPPRPQKSDFIDKLPYHKISITHPTTPQLKKTSPQSQ